LLLMFLIFMKFALTYFDELSVAVGNVYGSSGSVVEIV